jgi:hypothetical protein
MKIDGTQLYSGSAGFPLAQLQLDHHGPASLARSAYFDDFSFQSTPEPSTLALLAIGGIALAFWVRRHRRQSAAALLPGSSHQ